MMGSGRTRFLITAFATAVLPGHMPTVSRMADVAANPSADLAGLRGDLFHSVGGLLVLLVPLVLNIYKPRGMTPYGQRKRTEQRTALMP